MNLAGVPEAGVAGKPKQKLIPMDFPAWARLIRNAIHWATGFDPCATRAEARADDDSAHELAHLMTQWQVVCAERNVFPQPRMQEPTAVGAEFALQSILQLDRVMRAVLWQVTVCAPQPAAHGAIRFSSVFGSRRR